MLVSSSASLNNHTGKGTQAITALDPSYNAGNEPPKSYYAANDGGKIYKMGYTMGLGIAKKLSGKFSLQLNADFNSGGGKTALFNAVPNEVAHTPEWVGYNLVGNGNASFRMSNIKFPLNIQLFPFKKKSFYISAGIYYAQFLHAEEHGEFNGDYEYSFMGIKTGQKDSAVDFKYKNTDEYQKNDWGFQLGAGYNIQILNTKNFWINFEYSRGAANASTYSLYNTPPFMSPKFYNQSFSLGFSYFFKILIP